MHIHFLALEKKKKKLRCYSQSSSDRSGVRPVNCREPRFQRRSRAGSAFQKLHHAQLPPPPPTPAPRSDSSSKVDLKNTCNLKIFKRQQQKGWADKGRPARAAATKLLAFLEAAFKCLAPAAVPKWAREAEARRAASPDQLFFERNYIFILFMGFPHAVSALFFYVGAWG